MISVWLNFEKLVFLQIQSICVIVTINIDSLAFSDYLLAAKLVLNYRNLPVN